MKNNYLRNNHLLRIFILKTVILTLFLMAVSTWAAEKPVDVQNDKTQQVEYPPYPDVWGIDIPVANRVDYAAIWVMKMSNGDYLITYAKDWVKVREKEEPVNVGRLFFSGAVTDFKTDEYDVFFNKMRKERRIMKSSLIMFSDGSKVEIVTNMNPKGDDPFDWYMERKDKNGKVLLQKKLLYIYDKPVKKRTPLAERNFDYQGKYYYEKTSWPEELKYLPLEDDTFLFIGFLKYQNPPSIIIIRFDKDFKTKSDLVGRKVFLFDEEIYKKMKRPLDDQAANDYFYNYLIKIRKEK